MTSELRPVAVVSSTASDAHTWNLVYLQLLLEEHGFAVTNLGACVPDDLVVRECRRLDPNLLVLSTVNGHGHTDGLRLAPRLRTVLAGAALVIGGKLGVDGTSGRESLLREAGFDRVFGDGDIATFCRYLAELPVRVTS